MEADLTEPFLSRPEKAGLFLDFDGTLSDIVFVPSDARPVAGARDLLAALALKFGVVAIVSGRAAEELVDWLGPDVEIWGVHGAQRALNGVIELSDVAAPHAPLMREVYREAEKRLADLAIDGVILEDKTVMVTLHYRAAADVERARGALGDLADELVRRYGLTCGRGRHAFELRPPVELTKSAVVTRRAAEAGLEAVAFFGDDRVDLPGFDALDHLAGSGLATLRVAVDSEEAPPELLERADVVVDGPAGTVRFLQELLRS